MSQVALTIVSVLALALVASLVSRVLRLTVCPVCAGVVGTWLWMLAAREGGFLAVDTATLAMLLGASAAGLAQSIDARLRRGRSPGLWKALVLAAGFAVAYALALGQWIQAAIAAAALGLTVALTLQPRPAPPRDPEAVARLEERMKKCC